MIARGGSCRSSARAATRPGELFFTDCFLPDDRRHRRGGTGLLRGDGLFERSRVTLAANSIGIGRAALEYAVAYAKQREAFGKKIHEFQAVSFRLVDAKVALDQARLLMLHAADLADAGEPFATEASMAKLAASEAAWQAADAAVMTLGSYGYSRRVPRREVAARREARADLRGHERHPAPDHRALDVRPLSAVGRRRRGQGSLRDPRPHDVIPNRPDEGSDVRRGRRSDPDSPRSPPAASRSRARRRSGLAARPQTPRCLRFHCFRDVPRVRRQPDPGIPAVGSAPADPDPRDQEAAALRNASNAGLRVPSAAISPDCQPCRRRALVLEQEPEHHVDPRVPRRDPVRLRAGSAPAWPARRRRSGRAGSSGSRTR